MIKDMRAAVMKIAEGVFDLVVLIALFPLFLLCCMFDLFEKMIVK